MAAVGVWQCQTPTWRKQRSQLELLRQKRLKQQRFRRSPENYLLELETKLIQSILNCREAT